MNKLKPAGYSGKQLTKVRWMMDAVQKIVDVAASRDANMYREFAREIRRQHRTHQQSIMALMCAVINELAEDADIENYDLRNAAACRLAQRLRPVIDENPLPYI